MSALLGAFIAALCEHRELAPGERAVLLIISQTTRQASRCFNFLEGVFSSVPVLRALVIGQTSDTISLSNGIDVEVQPSSFRSIRGMVAIGIIADEVALWRTEETSRNPDREILDAARPALSTTGGMLIAISSPYAKAGELWNAYKRDYGSDGDPRILVAKAASRVMNPTLKQKIVDRAYERDAASAAAEYGAEFRNDVDAFISVDLIEACTDRGVLVRPPRAGVRYTAFADAASGTGQDSFAASIVHRDKDEFLLDLVHEVKPPFSAAAAIAEVCRLLKEYGVTRIVGDKWAPGFVSEGFARNGITYAYSERDRSQIYVEALPLLTSGRARLVDNRRLALQFAGLERRTSAGGKNSINHPTRSHDDLCNAAAGALVEAASSPGPLNVSPELMAWAATPARRYDGGGLSTKGWDWCPPPPDRRGSGDQRTGPPLPVWREGRG